MRYVTLPAILALALVAAFAIADDAAKSPPAVAIERTDDRVRITLAGEHFADYIHAGRAKPVIYPVHGPGGVPMTRRFPLQDKGPDEATDHPHHESLWFTHGKVNGVDFWLLGDKAGKIITQSLEAEADDSAAVVRSVNVWQKPDGSPVMSDQRTVRFAGDADARTIDFTITLKATHGEVTLGDTKEGTMGIRSHPHLNLTGKNANGKAVNSEGVRDKGVWGKRARWVAYWGKVDDKPVGFAIFDHPSNPRHPTWWHARDYGLVAANPFGTHDFDKTQPKAAGDMKIPNGESVTLRYRFVFYKGDADTAKIADRYARYAKP